MKINEPRTLTGINKQREKNFKKSLKFSLNELFKRNKKTSRAVIEKIYHSNVHDRKH